MCSFGGGIRIPTAPTPYPSAGLDGIACWDLRNKLETPRRTLKRVIMMEAVSAGFNNHLRR